MHSRHMVSDSAIFQVWIPNDLLSERRYAVKVIIETFLGFHAVIQPRDTTDVTLHLCGTPGQVRVTDHFFSYACSNWLRPGSFSSGDLPVWRLNEDVDCGLLKRDLPVLFGRPTGRNEWVRFGEKACSLNVDVFGAAFFMLTRYEEVVGDAVDQFGRFPAEETLSARANALDRPLVNEYVELLWACMFRVWPGLQRARREYRVLVTHDVDLPFSITGLPIWRVLHSMGGDLLRRSNPWLLRRRVRAAISRNPARRITMDPYFQFPYLFSIARRYGLRSAYYFIAGHTVSGGLDGFYSLSDPGIRALIRSVSQEGHEIGLHASYKSAECNSIAREFETLLKVCDEMGIRQDKWGGRHHYLRFFPRFGFSQWNDAGLNYDSSLGYVYCGAFRCGTCYEYPVFSTMDSLELPLRERPLIVMDLSLLVAAGSGAHLEQACEKVFSLAEQCRHFGGDFTLLWHNSFLQQEWERHAYETVIAGIT